MSPTLPAVRCKGLNMANTTQMKKFDTLKNRKADAELENDYFFVESDAATKRQNTVYE